MYFKSDIDLYNTDEYVRYSIDTLLANDERIDPDTVDLIYYDNRWSETVNTDIQIGDELVKIDIPYIIAITYIRRGQYAVMTNYYGYNPKAYECFREGEQQAFGRIKDVSWLRDIGNTNDRWDLVRIQRNIMKLAECGKETYVFDTRNKYLGNFKGLDYVLILSNPETQMHYSHYLDCLDDTIMVTTDVRSVPQGWDLPPENVGDYWTRQDLVDMSLTMCLNRDSSTYHLVHR